MNPDSFQQAWQSQPAPRRLTIDADVLLKEVQRNQRLFAACIFWRDVREVGVALVMVPVWIYLGVKSHSPWTWYLTVPALLWVAGFMLVDRRLQKRRQPQPSESLRQRIESSLAQVEHQIWLLRNVFWWYMLPPGLSVLAFFGQIAWNERGGGWLAALALGLALSIVALVFAAVYWLNQTAVRTELIPRRRELETLLASLNDEPPAPDVGAKHAAL